MTEIVSRRRFLEAAALGASALTLPSSFAAESDEKLNVVFILIDDLGWMDTGCYGSTYYETPNIDRLAASGTLFTDAYAACPVCSPTRASILTGRHPARLNMSAHIPAALAHRNPINSKYLPAKSIWELPLEEVTIAEKFKEGGYATAFIGKWHLSSSQKTKKDPDFGIGNPAFYPTAQGFDLNVAGCALGAPPSYFDPYGIPTLEDREKGEHLPSRLTEAATSFLNDNRDNPFFLYLSMYSVHTPIQARPDLLEKYRNKPLGDQKDPAYAAMVEAMDEAVGKVLDELDRLSLTETTAVVLFSDNGGLMRVTNNAPLRAGKGHLYEGGIREPLIIRWPGVTREGSTCTEPVQSPDLFPTFCDMAGVGLDANIPLDGTSLLPLLKGEEASFSRGPLYWHYPQYSPQGSRLSGAMRKGSYKLIEFLDDGSIEFYNVADDIGEKHDLAEKEKAMAVAMRDELHQWRRDIGANDPRPNPNYDPSKESPRSF